MFVLEVLGNGGSAGGVLQPLGPQPTYVGRAPNNDVVVLDPTVSGRHLAVWVRVGRIWIEDLQSRNGTFVDDEQVEGARRIEAGQTVRVGEHTRLGVRRAPSRMATEPGADTLMIEDVDAGVRYPFRSDRFRIGAAQGSDLVLEQGPDAVATLMLQGDGEVWLGVADEAREVPVDTPFEVRGRTLVVRSVPARVSVTREIEATRYPYALSARLDGPRAPVAEVRDVHTGQRHEVTGETRAVLLYLLGRERAASGDAPPEDAGWCDDREVMVGIWGKSGAEAPLSKLNTLVCRVRKELRQAGFDPWFIEKRRGAIRARVREAEIE